jgi:hypothetical protein
MDLEVLVKQYSIDFALVKPWVQTPFSPKKGRVQAEQGCGQQEL